MTHFDRVVIGAGISGLLAAWRAVGRGERVLVLEREPSAGGVIQPIELQSDLLGRVVIDAGAESFSTAGGSCERLVAELGLGDSVVAPTRADARIVYSADRRYRIPHGVLGIPSSLDDPELLGIISGDGLALARELDSQPLANIESFTVAQLVENRLGPEFVEKLVDPMMAGVHGSSARVLNARSTLPALLGYLNETQSLVAAAAMIRGNHPRPGSAVAGIAGGLFKIVDRLTQVVLEAGASIVFNANVSGIFKENSSWQVQTGFASYWAPRLTIATSVDKSTSLVSRAADLVDEPSMSMAVDSTLVFAVVESHELNLCPLGSGALVAKESGFEAKATTHVNAKWAWVQDQLPKDIHLIRLSYGRDGALPRQDLQQLAARELWDLYGVNVGSIHQLKTVRWSEALYQPTASAKERVERTKQLARDLDIELCGALVAGNGLLGIAKDHYERLANESIQI